MSRIFGNEMAQLCQHGSYLKCSRLNVRWTSTWELLLKWDFFLSGHLLSRCVFAVHLSEKQNQSASTMSPNFENYNSGLHPTAQVRHKSLKRSLYHYSPHMNAVQAQLWNLQLIREIQSFRKADLVSASSSISF